MAHRREIVPLAQATSPFYIGVDVGGTNIKIGLVDDLGHTLGFTSIATKNETGPEDALQRVTAAIDLMLAELGLTRQDVASIGLGTPGTMDIPAGMILEPVNFPGWRHFPLRDRLSELCQLRVAFANDAAAAAFGEYWIGSGKRFHSIVLLTLGTGIGGGIIIGDRSIDGENSHGSECGHIIIDSSETARVCSCGQRGHLEAYVSAVGLVKRAEEALQDGRQSSLQSCLDAGQPLTSLQIAQQAEAGDELSLELVLKTAFYLGIGIVTLTYTIDPGAVILGGAMTFGGDQSELGIRFIQRVREVVLPRIFPVPAERLTIEFASLGSAAGYLGAAGIARAAQQKTASSPQATHP